MGPGGFDMQQIFAAAQQALNAQQELANSELTGTAGGGAVPDACSQPSTGATVALLVVAFWILVVLARPFRLWKAGLIAAMVLLAVLAFVIPMAQRFFDFSLPAGLAWQSLAVGVVGAVCVEIVYRVAHSARRTAAERAAQG